MGILEKFKPRYKPTSGEVLARIERARRDWLDPKIFGPPRVWEDQTAYTASGGNIHLVASFGSDTEGNWAWTDGNKGKSVYKIRAWDLSGLNLTGQDLRFVSFYNLNMKGINLSVANLRGARFEGCDLRGASFAFSDLSWSTIKFCDLRGTLFDAADLWDMNSSLNDNKIKFNFYHIDCPKKNPKCFCLTAKTIRKDSDWREQFEIYAHDVIEKYG